MSLKIERKWNDAATGVPMIKWSALFWEGPEAAGETGAHVRRAFTAERKFALSSVGPTCSFYGELKKAVGS